LPLDGIDIPAIEDVPDIDVPPLELPRLASATAAAAAAQSTTTTPSVTAFALISHNSFRR